MMTALGTSVTSLKVYACFLREGTLPAAPWPALDLVAMDRRKGPHLGSLISKHHVEEEGVPNHETHFLCHLPCHSPLI